MDIIKAQIRTEDVEYSYCNCLHRGRKRGRRNRPGVVKEGDEIHQGDHGYDLIAKTYERDAGVFPFANAYKRLRLILEEPARPARQVRNCEGGSTNPEEDGRDYECAPYIHGKLAIRLVEIVVKVATNCR